MDEPQTATFEEVAEMAHAKGYKLQYEERGNMFWYNLYHRKDGMLQDRFIYLHEVVGELEESN